MTIDKKLYPIIGVIPMLVSTFTFGHFDNNWVIFTPIPLCIVSYVFTRYETSFPKIQWFCLLTLVGFLLAFLYKEYVNNFGYWLSIIPFIICDVKYKYKKHQDKLNEFNYDSKLVERDNKIEKILNKW